VLVCIAFAFPSVAYEEAMSSEEIKIGPLRYRILPNDRQLVCRAAALIGEIQHD
jgi:hypothetical protein